MCDRRSGLDRGTAGPEYQPVRAPVPAATCASCGGALCVAPSATLAGPASFNVAQIAVEDSQQALHVECTGIPAGELPRIRTWQCASPATAHSAGPALAAAVPARRQRSVTPMELAGKHASDTDSCECMGPITPAAASSQAAGSPGPTAKATAGVPASPRTAADALGGAAGCTAYAEPSAQRAASAAALWLRIRSFMDCVAASPLVHSALLSLELGGTHPLAAEPGLPASEALQWTLGQLLAMHLKADLAEASEHTVLACLWLLESVESVWRSPATVCLNDYLKHLAVFSPEAVVAITADWKRSFRELRQGVVAAQSDLLQRLGWLIRLDLVSEVKPCLDLLFRLPRGAKQALAEASVSRASAAATRQAWALRMHCVCAQVQQQAVHLRNPARTAQRRPKLSEVEEEAQLTPTKRQRVHRTLS